MTKLESIETAASASLTLIFELMMSHTNGPFVISLTLQSAQSVGSGGAVPARGLEYFLALEDEISRIVNSAV